MLPLSGRADFVGFNGREFDSGSKMGAAAPSAGFSLDRIAAKRASKNDNRVLQRTGRIEHSKHLPSLAWHQ